MKSLSDKTSDPLNAKCSEIVPEARKLRKRSRHIRESAQNLKKSSAAKRRDKQIMRQWAKDALQAGSQKLE